MRLDQLNEIPQEQSLAVRNALCGRLAYNLAMAAPHHDWYLKEWLKAVGKKQADMARELEWNKAKVSLTANGVQPYDRDDVNEASAYLNIQPYELLMHPEDAMALRRLKRDAAKIAATQEAEDTQLSREQPKVVSLS
jgi:transcriptional regulator with XRE-family HTH domain